MSTKHLADMTVAELAALPIYEPGIKVPLTPEDRARGMQGKSKEVANPLKLVVSCHEPKDPMWLKVDGILWFFVQDVGGNWWRRYWL